MSVLAQPIFVFLDTASRKWIAVDLADDTRARADTPGQAADLARAYLRGFAAARGTMATHPTRERQHP